MPAVSALAPPNGWPLAKTKSPGRKLAESPIAAAGRSPASTLIMATSRSGSHPLTSARNARPSGSTTVAKRWATWALVTMWPSGRQMTPEPYPELRPWTRTVIWRIRSASSARVSGRAKPAAPRACSNRSPLPLRPVAHRDLDLGRRPGADDLGAHRRSNALRAEDGLYVIRLSHRSAIERYQHVSHEQSGRAGRATGLDVDDDQSRSAREAERVRERLRQSNRMQRQAKVAAGDVAAREELVADATDRRDGDGHRRVS